MIIIDARESDSIDKALKKYKKKLERAGILKELRGRRHFVKNSIKRRQEVLRAAYKERMYGSGAQ